MKTLVIHPKDQSTDFLKYSYSDLNCTVVNCVNISKSKIKNLIKNHDRIILLGHGTEKGLYHLNNYVIDSSLLYLLRDNKDLIAIWCNANLFFEKYNLKGVYSGMIVSEYEEALLYCLPTNEELINISNILLSKSLKLFFDNGFNFNLLKNNYKSDNNDIISFNKNNLYIND